jgi:hypothetical protein
MFDDFERAANAGRRSILTERGGCSSVGEVAAPFGRDCASVAQQAANPQLIATKGDEGDLLVRRCLIDGGAVMPGLPRIVAILHQRPGYSDVTSFVFLLGPDSLTDSESPIDALAAGDLASVEEAALSTLY